MLIALLACPVFTSCYDDSALNERLDKVEQDVTQIKSDLAALKDAVDNNLSVVDYNQVEGGYELIMSDGSKINIYNGADGAKGDKGDKGDTGAQGPQGPQGPAGADGTDGQNGTDGVDGKDGQDGDAFFQSVELSEDGAYLIITLVDGTVYELPMGSTFNILFTLSETKIIAGETYKVPYQIVGAAESDEVVVRILSSSNCEAAIIPSEKVVSVTPAYGAGYVDLYAINNTTGELKAKTISFSGEEFFEVAATVFYVSPAGGEVEVPVTTSADYELVISDAWLAYAETKAIREETVVLVAAAENTTTADYTATVTMKSNTTGKELASFEVVQKNYYPELIADENGEVVEWAESFNLYKKADLTGDAEAKKGVFTFELSDDFAKGAYKVKNLFYADLYFHNSQMVQSQGGEYYADVEGDVLTVYYAGATLSYGFTSDVELTYDATAKAFSAETIATYSYSTYRNVWMADYAAAVKVEAPAQEGSIAGVWEQSVTVGTGTASATVTVEVSGDQVTLTDFIYEGTVVTGTLSGNTITIPKNTMISNTTGPLSSDVVLTLSDDTSTLTAADFQIGGWVNVTGYTATR